MGRKVGQQNLDLGAATPKGMVARTRKGVDVTIRELRQQEAITPAHEAMVALARSLADMLDRELTCGDPSAYNVAQLSGKLTACVDRLTMAMGQGTDSTMADFLASITTPQ